MATVIPLAIVALGGAIVGYVEARGGFPAERGSIAVMACAMWLAYGVKLYLSRRQ